MRKEYSVATLIATTLLEETSLQRSKNIASVTPDYSARRVRPSLAQMFKIWLSAGKGS